EQPDGARVGLGGRRAERGGRQRRPLCPDHDAESCNGKQENRGPSCESNQLRPHFPVPLAPWLCAMHDYCSWRTTSCARLSPRIISTSAGCGTGGGGGAAAACGAAVAT